MTRHRCFPRASSISAISLAVAVSACGAPPAATPAERPVTVAVPASATPTGKAADASGQDRFRCRVEVRALGAQFVGEASAEPSGAAGQRIAEDAKREACKKLWKAEKVDCEDESRVATVNRQTRYRAANGKATLSVRVVLRSLRGPFGGTATSPHSGREACHRAVADGCRKAPAGSECSGRGLYCSASPDDLTAWQCSSTPPRNAPSRAPSPFEA